MKQKKFIGLCATFFVVLSSVLFFSCQKDDGVFSAQEAQSCGLTQAEKESVESLFSSLDVDYMLPTGDKLTHFRGLNSLQLDYYFVLWRNELATLIGTDILSGESELSQDEWKNLFTSQKRAINELAIRKLNKPYNKLTEEEASKLFNNDIIDITILQKKWCSSPKELKILDDYLTKLKNEAGRKQNISRNLLSRSALRSVCGAYAYKIKTYIASSGTYPCIDFAEATNIGDNDCDYEFAFDWPYNHSPAYKLGLYPRSWKVRRILKLGGVNGRVTPDNTVRFLVGKGRMRLLFLSPEDFQKDILGEWGSIV